MTLRNPQHIQEFTDMRTLTLTALLLILTFISAEALAAPLNALSTTYFDANGKIIGQNITWCDGSRLHAGTIDANNPFLVTQRWSCSDTGSCVPDANSPTGYQCLPYQGTYYKNVAYLEAPNGWTAEQFCNDALITVNGPYYGRLSCDAPEPDTLIVLSGYTR